MPKLPKVYTPHNALALQGVLLLICSSQRAYWFDFAFMHLADVFIQSDRQI